MQSNRNEDRDNILDRLPFELWLHVFRRLSYIDLFKQRRLNHDGKALSDYFLKSFTSTDLVQYFVEFDHDLLNKNLAFYKKSFDYARIVRNGIGEDTPLADILLYILCQKTTPFKKRVHPLTEAIIELPEIILSAKNIVQVVCDFDATIAIGVLLAFRETRGLHPHSQDTMLLDRLVNTHTTGHETVLVHMLTLSSPVRDKPKLLDLVKTLYVLSEMRNTYKKIPVNNLQRANHTYQNFSDIVNFSDQETPIESLNFSGLMMWNASFRHVKYVNARYAVMTHLNVTNGSLTHVYFGSAQLDHAKFNMVEVINCDFKESNLSDSAFRDVEATDCDFSDANFQKATFNNSRFINSQFVRADMGRMIEVNSRFIKCNFDNAQFCNESRHIPESIVAQTQSCSFINAKFAQNNNIYIQDNGSDFSQATFSGGNVAFSCNGSIFTNAKFSGMRVKLELCHNRSTFNGAEFFQTKLELTADFSKDLLPDFTGAKFKQVDLVGLTLAMMRGNYFDLSLFDVVITKCFDATRPVAEQFTCFMNEFKDPILIQGFAEEIANTNSLDVIKAALAHPLFRPSYSLFEKKESTILITKQRLLENQSPMYNYQPIPSFMVPGM